MVGFFASPRTPTRQPLHADILPSSLFFHCSEGTILFPT